MDREAKKKKSREDRRWSRFKSFVIYGLHWWLFWSIKITCQSVKGNSAHKSYHNNVARWKKPVISAIMLDPEDMESAEDVECTGDILYKFRHCLIAWWQFFKDSNIEELIQCMFVHITMQMENPCVLDGGFMLSQIMLLHIVFHKLALTGGSTYTALPEWIAMQWSIQKVMMNSALNGLLLQHWIKKRLSIITTELACYGIMKISATGKGLDFH